MLGFISRCYRLKSFLIFTPEALHFSSCTYGSHKFRSQWRRWEDQAVLCVLSRTDILHPPTPMASGGPGSHRVLSHQGAPSGAGGLLGLWKPPWVQLLTGFAGLACEFPLSDSRPPTPAAPTQLCSSSSKPQLGTSQGGLSFIKLNFPRSGQRPGSREAAGWKPGLEGRREGRLWS